MPPITRSRAVRERREEAARRVLAAVHTLVADGTPYTELPVQLIAETAGVPRSTFYLHFPDKARLLIALAEQGGHRLFDAAITWWRADHHDGQAGLLHATRAMITEYRANQWILLALSEVAAYDPDVAAYYHTQLERFTHLSHRRLDTEQHAGTINPTLDTNTTAHLLTWMVERTISMHCRNNDTTTDEQAAHTLARAIWLTIYGDTPTAPPTTTST